MKYRFQLTAAIAALLACVVLPVAAQNDQSLELQTDDGQILVPLDDGVPVRLLGNGNISAKAAEGFSCPTDGPSCEDVTVSVKDIDGGSLSIQPNPVSLGSNLQINWSSVGAWSCTGSGLPGTTWNSTATKAPSGSQSVSTADLQVGSYSVNLECSNGPVFDSRSLSLTVEEDAAPPPPAGCEGVTELSDFSEWTESTDLLFGTPPSWEHAFSNSFPKGNTFTIKLDKGQYAAMRLTTPSYLNSLSDGSINGESASGSTYGSGPRMMSITPCPGVFDPDEIENPGCLLDQAYLIDSFEWVGPGHKDAHDTCELQPNTTYYFNVLFSDSPAGTMPPVQDECASTAHSRCGMKLEPRDNNQ